MKPASAARITMIATKLATMDFRVMKGMFVSSEPDANARNQAGVFDVLAVGAGEIGAAAEFAAPHHTQVGRELAAELVAQPQAEFAAAHARAEPALAIVPPVRLGPELWLPDQPVAAQQFGFRLDACVGKRRFTSVCGRFEQ